MLEFWRQWDQFLLLGEFVYNNSYHTSIWMAPFESLYGWKCRTLVMWFIYSLESIQYEFVVGCLSQDLSYIG